MSEEKLLKEINDLISLDNDNKFKTRKLKKFDWNTLVGWWKWWRWPEREGWIYI
jgi:hypothetical protein